MIWFRPPSRPRAGLVDPRCLGDDQRRGWLRTTLANIAVSGFRREAAFRDRLPRIEARYRKTPPTPRRRPFHRSRWSGAGRSSRTAGTAARGGGLRWQQDMKEGEIAAALGMTEKTVSAHLHRARHKLIAQLGPDHPFAGGDVEGASS
jgi:hypothetical protein